VLIVPAVAHHKARRSGLPHWAQLVTGTVALACVLTLVISAGVAVYSYNGSIVTAGSLPPVRTTPPTPATVAILQDVGDVLTDAEVENMVRKTVAMVGGLDEIVQPGQTVVIKPNLVQTLSPAGEGITTDPRVVRAVVRLAQEAGAARVVIAEGTASSRNGEYLARDVTWKAFKDSGYDSDGDHVDDETGVELYDLNDTGGIGQFDTSKVASVMIPNGVIRVQYWVPKMLLKPAQGGFCDVLITVPCLKNHGNGGITLTLKNRVGCAPSDIYHADFEPYLQQLKWGLVHNSIKFPRGVVGGGAYPVPPATNEENAVVQYTIVDLNLVRPQEFAVVDGLVGITNGPVGVGGVVTQANPKRKFIMAGKDSVAIDAIGTLTMGYDFRQVPHIAWADNRLLGTMDLTAIDVIGDHVAKVRLDFPAGYGETIRADSTDPVLSSVALTEGQVMAGPTSIACSAFDNGGVVKAELSLLPIKHNLLVNGDFETGTSTGWTAWQSPWGGSFIRDFANTESGRLGNYCLRLGNASTSGSFGVYQEVNVTPGKTYRVDAYWRGQKLGDMNWFEVLLIDGAWDMAKADSGGEPVVRQSYMYAYDNYTYGLPGPIGTTFGWNWTDDLDGTLVDWNGRWGERTATGSKMTVVLKAGSTTSGVSLLFDSVSLVEVGTEQVAARVAYPGSDFALQWDASNADPGQYLATVTVYDGAMNEDSVTRLVNVTIPQVPFISLSKNEFKHTIGVRAPLTDSFTVTNTGVDTLQYSISVNEPWLSVDPVEGASTGEADTITVNYDMMSLFPGTYSATITVSDPAAYNNPQIIPVSLVVRPVKADFDTDGDVDLEDFSTIQLCLTGPGIFYTKPECDGPDLDDDHDVDVDDMRSFQPCLTGHDRMASATCE
jgi:uncharacterized protein (DUF362 family)